MSDLHELAWLGFLDNLDSGARRVSHFRDLPSTGSGTGGDPTRPGAANPAHPEASQDSLDNNTKALGVIHGGVSI